MKKFIQYVIVFSLLTWVLAASLIQAVPEMIGISNVTVGESKAGTFEIKGVILNDGQVSRVAVKAGIGPWENAAGVDRFSYTVDTRHIVLSYDNETPVYGPFYGDLSIVIGAFKANGDQVSEKTVNVTVIPEKPYSDVISGAYLDPLNVILKAAPEVTTYYTTDGTDPITNGTSYTGPIYVSQNTIIKAVTKSATNQYSETAILDLKIESANPPAFLVQYYDDQAFSRPLPDPAYLKAGTYYLKIVSDRKFSGNPLINIDAPGTTNDVINTNIIPVSDCVFQYTRTVSEDPAADGYTQETITISGTDLHGNPIQNLAPTNGTVKAAYLDTQAPPRGLIWLEGNPSSTNDPTPLLNIDYTSADWMRLALSEPALSTAPWVGYTTTQYDEFDISGGGNGAKYIWVEFKDRAGNIQTQHSFAVVSYDNAITSYDIEYYRDSNLTQSLGNSPYLKEGTYYLKITANQDLGSNPSLQIDAEGANNDVTSGLTVIFNPRIYYYTRTIVADSAAVGTIKEQIMIQGINPSNVATKGAYTDTQAPGIPVITGPANTVNPKPTWSWNSVAGACRYRYSFTDGSNWVETTATSFTPADNLTPGNSYTLYVQAGDQAGNWSAGGSYTVTITTSEINVKQGTENIPSGTGNYSFGDVSVFSFRNVTFTVENTGTGNLNLTGTPIVQISGADASCFSVTTQPSTPVAPAGSTTFVVKFAPAGLGTKTANISIANNDSDENPYTFTITGNGTVEAITLHTLTPGNISFPGEIKTYSFNATVGQCYAINWAEGALSGGEPYTCNIKVSAYRQNLTTPYFTAVDNGFYTPKTFIAQDNIVYLKVAGYNATSTGSFAVKPYLNNMEINIKQGTTDLPDETGSYNFGEVTAFSKLKTTFTIENTGTGELNFNGSYPFYFTHGDLGSFNITARPSSPVAPSGSVTLEIEFNPKSIGMKNATIEILNEDTDESVYHFNVTGTGTVEPLTLSTWTPGIIPVPDDGRTYSFNAIVGKRYGITWDDSYQGSGSYNGNVSVTAYHQDFSTYYFSYVNSGYTTPQFITAEEDTVYLKVKGYLSDSTGTYALKAFLDESEIEVKQGTTGIPSGTGSYDFGEIPFGTFGNANFTIENSGTGNLNLTGSPVVQISGADASAFSVITQPTSPVLPGGSATFAIRFNPTNAGVKTATVSIANNQFNQDENPYTFTITGTATSVIDTLTPDTWTPGNLSAPGEAKAYRFDATVGKRYAINWDDNVQGSGTYTGRVQVAAYRQDFTTTYFTYETTGYASPRNIYALDNTVYLQVIPLGSATGSFAIKVTEIPEPEINLKQGTTNVPSNGSFDFGNVPIGTYSYVAFTIENIGNQDLNLTGSPRVQISGAGASSFLIWNQPSSPIDAGGNVTFEIRFAPTATDTKTATIYIANNDYDENPYSFTISGTGANPSDTLTPATWTPGNISEGREAKAYRFDTTPGKIYSIAWDDSLQGSGAYTGQIQVAAYRQDFTTTYFSYTTSGYTNPRFITALENTVYLRVISVNSTTGSFALKAAEEIPIPAINVKQGSTNLPNGTGNYNYNHIWMGANKTVSFTVQNTGTADLNLNGSPRVQISGADAACFSVTFNPAATIGMNGSSSFQIKFTALGAGTKTATVSIENNVSGMSPYTFTITGSGDPLTLGNWIPGSISSAGEIDMYGFVATPGATYSVSWDDKWNGTGAYTCDVKVTAYRQDMTTTYFSNYDSGYTSPRIITALDNVVFLKVQGYLTSYTGSYAIKAANHEPIIGVKQGTTDLPNAGIKDRGPIPRIYTSMLTGRIWPLHTLPTPTPHIPVPDPLPLRKISFT